METSFKYLVPIDFTPETENALVFAIDSVKYNKGRIILLHIIQGPKERIAAEFQLKELADKYRSPEVEIETRVVIGKVLKDMGVIADSLGVQAIIMGTHSTSIWQKVFGSPALSVISNSNVPIIMTQADTSFHKIKTIVMTIDLEKESIQVVKYAAQVAKIFHSKVYVVGQQYADENFKNKIEVNMRVVNDYLQQYELPSSVHLLSQNNFAQELLEYCKEVDANLLAVTYYKENFHVFSSNLVQSLAENPLKIPVMTFDGEDTSSGAQFGFITQ